MPELFDMRLRALRRDRAFKVGPELFLFERAFEDCVERISLLQRHFDRALLLGCPDANWPRRLEGLARTVETLDPGPLFAAAAKGQTVIEDRWEPAPGRYDLVVAIGTLDTVNDLALALRLIGHGMGKDALFLAAMSGGDTLPQLRAAMRAADALGAGAAAHVHPRIEASALAALLTGAGFTNPVVDIDRVTVAYPSFDRLVGDLRQMGSTNMLNARARFIGRRGRKAAADAFRLAGNGSRTTETFEILHLACWTTGQR